VEVNRAAGESLGAREKTEYFEKRTIAIHYASIQGGAKLACRSGGCQTVADYAGCLSGGNNGREKSIAGYQSRSHRKGAIRKRMRQTTISLAARPIEQTNEFPASGGRAGVSTVWTFTTESVAIARYY
jgi:hypothetical protein